VEFLWLKIIKENKKIKNKEIKRKVEIEEEC